MPNHPQELDLSTISGRCRARVRLAADLARRCTDGELFRRCRRRHIPAPLTALAAAQALAFAAIPEDGAPIPTTLARRAAR
jgi:hypothetical protein